MADKKALSIFSLGRSKILILRFRAYTGLCFIKFIFISQMGRLALETCQSDGISDEVPSKDVSSKVSSKYDLT